MISKDPRYFSKGKDCLVKKGGQAVLELASTVLDSYSVSVSPTLYTCKWRNYAYVTDLQHNFIHG